MNEIGKIILQQKLLLMHIFGYMPADIHRIGIVLPSLMKYSAILKYAGYDRIEIMESILRYQDSVNRLNDLVHKHDLPVTGISYNGNMWDKNQQQHILDDIEVVLERLRLAGGKMIGLTVGDAKRTKTEGELDTQADTLKKVVNICKKE